MITEDYCSYEVAKLLKEKGFDEPCTELNKLCLRDGEKPVLKVTHQKAMKWLREVHKIHIQVWCPFVDFDADKFGIKYNVVISNLNNCCIAFDTDIDENHYNSYEEAVEAALKYCLENLI